MCQNGAFVLLQSGEKDPDPRVCWQVPNAHAPSLKYYNEIIPPLYKSTYGKVANFKGYLKSQQNVRWEVVQEIEDLQKKTENLKKDS